MVLPREKPSGNSHGTFVLKESFQKGNLMVFQSHDFSGSYVKLRGVIVCLFFEGNIKKRLERHFVTQRNWEDLPKEIWGDTSTSFTHRFWMNLFLFFLLETG